MAAADQASYPPREQPFSRSAPLPRRLLIRCPARALCMPALSLHPALFSRPPPSSLFYQIAAAEAQLAEWKGEAALAIARAEGAEAEAEAAKGQLAVRSLFSSFRRFSPPREPRPERSRGAALSPFLSSTSFLSFDASLPPHPMLAPPLPSPPAERRRGRGRRPYRRKGIRHRAGFRAGGAIGAASSSARRPFSLPLVSFPRGRAPLPRPPLPSIGAASSSLFPPPLPSFLHSLTPPFSLLFFLSFFSFLRRRSRGPWPPRRSRRPPAPPWPNRRRRLRLPSPAQVRSKPQHMFLVPLGSGLIISRGNRPGVSPHPQAIRPPSSRREPLTPAPPPPLFPPPPARRQRP